MSPHRRAPQLGDAGVVILLSFGCFYLAAFAPPEIAGLAFALPPLAWAAASRLDFRRAFFFRSLPLRQVVPVLLVCAGSILVVGFLAQALPPLFLRLGLDFSGEMVRLHERVSRLPVLSVTLLPAVCEEIFFRGILLAALAAAFPEGRALAYTAVLFGAVHVLVPSVIATTLLGLQFGALVLLTRSLWAAMIAHLLNNASALLLMKLERETNLLPIMGIGVGPGAVLLVTGLLLLRPKGAASGAGKRPGADRV